MRTDKGAHGENVFTIANARVSTTPSLYVTEAYISLPAANIPK